MTKKELADRLDAVIDELMQRLLVPDHEPDPRYDEDIAIIMKHTRKD